MGCDIHMYVEHTDPKASRPYWATFGGRINPGRDYRLFANLAGVRGYGDTPQMVETRGLPPHLSLTAKWDNELYVSDENEGEEYCTRENAESWIKHGVSEWTDERQVSVTHPDHHTHSWCTIEELRSVLNAERPAGYGAPDDEYWALLAACEELVRRGREVRIVFWFDN